MATIVYIIMLHSKDNNMKKQPRPGSPEFKALQKEWYDRLKAKGFKDIEDSKGNIKKPSHLLFHKNRNNTNRYDYFRLLDQYMTSGYRQFNKWGKLDKAAFRLHAQGYSLRESANILKAKKNLNFNHSYLKVKALIDPMVDACMEWHRESPAGSLNPANADVLAEEVLIRERHAYYDTSHGSKDDMGMN